MAREIRLALDAIPLGGLAEGDRGRGQGAVRARRGTPGDFSGALFFWSNQSDKRLDDRGYAPGFERIVTRGDPAALDFIAFYVHGG